MSAKYDRSDLNSSWKINFSLFFPHSGNLVIWRPIFRNYRIFWGRLTVPTFSTIIYCKNITDFSNSDFSKNSIFQRDSLVPIKKFLLKSPAKFKNSKLPIKVMHDDHDFFVRQVWLLHSRVGSQVCSLQVIDTGLTVTLLGDDPYLSKWCLALRLAAMIVLFDAFKCLNYEALMNLNGLLQTDTNLQSLPILLPVLQG